MLLVAGGIVEDGSPPLLKVPGFMNTFICDAKLMAPNSSVYDGQEKDPTHGVNM